MGGYLCCATARLVADECVSLCVGFCWEMSSVEAAASVSVTLYDQMSDKSTGAQHYTVHCRHPSVCFTVCVCVCVTHTLAYRVCVPAGVRVHHRRFSLFFWHRCEWFMCVMYWKSEEIHENRKKRIWWGWDTFCFLYCTFLRTYSWSLEVRKNVQRTPH